MRQGGQSAPGWRRRGDRLFAEIEISQEFVALARSYALHRLRAARALTHGFLHPIDIHVAEHVVHLEFAQGALDRPNSRPRSFVEWRDTRLLPMLSILLRCHDEGVADLGRLPLVDGAWVPPVSWFLPMVPAIGVDRAALRTVLDWLDAEHRDGRHGPGIESFREALNAGDLVRLRRLVLDTQTVENQDRTPDAVVPPSFLTLLTEGELLERVATSYRYRWLKREEVVDLGLDPRGQLVLELDRTWADPHFPSLTKPAPREVWDALVEDSRVTPVLALSVRLPNPLDKRLEDDLAVRWIGTHADQPLIYVQHGGRRIPPRGFARLHLAGDNALMERKRAFVSFAGAHPSLSEWLASPRPAVAFTDNPQPREELEETILATRGVFAVQGPPGTGKTHLATEVVRRFLERTPEGRVLVCAKEHFALDHILRKITGALSDHGLPFRAWRSVSLAKRRRGRGEVDESWLAPAVTRDLARRSWRPEFSAWSQWQAATSELHDERLTTLGRQSANLFFATTMDASLGEFLGRESFDLVIVEEAGKCYPSELLHALCLGRTCLMIGDQRQLPPYQERRTREGIEAWQTTLRRASTDREFRDEMIARFGRLYAELEALMHHEGEIGERGCAWLRPFEYLFDRLPTRHRLEEQFRMEAPLSRAVGSVFYGRPFTHRKHELVTAGHLSPRPLGHALPRDLDVPMLWIDTPHMTDHPQATEDAAKQGARDNAFELEVVLAYLRRLRPDRPLDLVILTPYNAQKRLMLDHEGLRSACERLTDRPLEQVVRTTDEYQGREAELTVLSLVRNNSLGARAWGFMTEPERLNVMFSRTRFRQVVVGCSAHIERHAEACGWLARFWRAYTEEARHPDAARILTAQEVLGG